MRTIIVTNNTGSDQTYAGQLILDTESHTLQSEAERLAFAANTNLNSHLWAGTTTIGDGTNTFSAADGDKWIKNLSMGLVDSDGVPLSRNKITRTGWHLQEHAIEFCSSTLNSGYNKDEAGNDLGFLTLKFYDDQDVELTVQGDITTDCVKTVAEWEPTEDFEVLGGTLHQSTAPVTDIRIWVTSAPDIPAGSGGSIPFTTGGINLKHLGTGKILDIDGKAPKLVPYIPATGSTKFKITLKHSAGNIHCMHLIFNIFRLNT